MRFKKIIFIVTLLSGASFFCANADNPAVGMPEQREQTIHVCEKSLQEEQNQQGENKISKKQHVCKALRMVWNGTKIVSASILFSMFIYEKVLPGDANEKFLVGCIALIPMSIMILESLVASKPHVKTLLPDLKEAVEACTEKLVNKIRGGEVNNEN